MNPSSLSVAEMAKLLGVSEKQLRDDISVGAPVNADGTINLVHYAAWLLKEMGGRGGDGS